MIDLLSGRGRVSPHVRLNRLFRSDLAWWQLFVPSWNGVGLIAHLTHTTGPCLNTDTSSSWGCGAWSGVHWFQLEWDVRSTSLPIAVKDLIRIILAAGLWGRHWAGQVVTCHCDNTVVVSAVQFRSCRQQQHMMHLLRCLFFIEARFDFQLRCKHIPGGQNDKADDLSRNNVNSFLAKVPKARTHPSVVQPSLLELLLAQELDFLSP